MSSSEYPRGPADAARGYSQPGHGLAPRRPGALLMSLLLHLGLLVLLGLLIQQRSLGVAESPDRTGGIVLVQNNGDQVEYFQAEDVSSTTSASTAEQVAAANLTAAPDEVELSLPGSLPQPAEAGEAAVGLPLDPGEDLLRAEAGREAGEYAVETGLFGARAEGTRFIYVFDRSASMNSLNGRPLAAAKSQLIGSLQDLGDTQQFQVIFYNDEPTILNPYYPRPPRLLFADKQNRKLAADHVRGVVATGTTRHEEPLLLAIKMSPDVIFFLTDAEQPVMSRAEVERVSRRNQAVGASIHAIQFGIGPAQGGDNFLRRLAERNGGNHVYVDVTRLPSRRP